MKFIVDTQLPPRLAKFLSAKGFDAIHTTRLPEGHLLDDESIRRIAKLEERIVVTKDIDFFDRYLVKGFPPRVLLLRLGNASNSELLATIEAQLPLILELFDDGAGLIQLQPDSIVRF